MKVVALVGPSGTGKSHHAFTVARKYNTDLIIDDGLLIQGARVIAGFSAKRESTKLKAVRRAIFSDPAHCREVKDKIREIDPDSILVLGTSREMISRITAALELPEPEEVVTITSVATPAEIFKARQIRRQQGKHVIPAPTLEIKRYFSGYLLDPLKIFARKGKSIIPVEEKSVVRPTFSYMGRYTISDTAITSIIAYEAARVEGVIKAGRIDIESRFDGIIVHMDVFIEYGKPIREILREVQERVVKQLEYMTALNVISINVTASKIIVKKETLMQKNI
jgi:uncharacterized alkaline shock family protein YloU